MAVNPWWIYGRPQTPESVRDPKELAGVPELNADSEGDLTLPPLTFTVIPSSTITISGTSEDFYATAHDVTYACPLCRWNGPQAELLAHFQFHERFALAEALGALLRR